MSKHLHANCFGDTTFGMEIDTDTIAWRKFKAQIKFEVIRSKYGVEKRVPVVPAQWLAAIMRDAHWLVTEERDIEEFYIEGFMDDRYIKVLYDARKDDAKMDDNRLLEELKAQYEEGGEERGMLVYIPVDQLHPHPDNPRKELGDLSELVESIKAKGVMQNLTVVPRAEGGYTVIIGHRRSAAAKEAGLSAVPCVIVEMSEREQVATMLLENMQRVDLTAYEQAQGFQMMIDFGDTVEGIAEKTGFSKKTVRGRLKMAELDSKILKEVSSARQLSIADFDKLAQIDDLGKRNELLRFVGTNNFEQAHSRALKLQKVDNAMPHIQKAIKDLHGNKIKYSETYGGKYTWVTDIKIEDFKSNDEICIPEKHKGEKLFYYIDEYQWTLRLYVLSPRATPVKRSKAEIEREKVIREAHDRLKAIESEAYRLRFNFIRDLKVTKDNVDAVKEGAFLALLCEQHFYSSHINKREVYEDVGGVSGIKELYMTASILECVMKAYTSAPKTMYPAVIYASFGDGASEHMHSTYMGEYPKPQKNTRIKLLYTWLTSLGYEMSDDEKGLMDGTHPIFKDHAGKE